MTRPEGSAPALEPTRPDAPGPPPSERAQWWRLFVAVLVGLAGILLSAAAWNALRTTERAQIEAGLDTTAAELSRAFESGFGLQLEHLRDLASTWNRTISEDGTRWQAEAKLFRNLHEECLALEWDPRALPAAILASETPESRNLLALRPTDPVTEGIRQAAVKTVTEVRLGPWSGPDGRRVVEILIPVAVEPGKVSILTALTEPGLALERMAGPPNEDFALEVFDGRISLFRRGEPAGGELAGLMESRHFRVGGQGIEWTVAVQPGRKMLGSPQRLLQWMVLIGGIVLSMLFATTFWVGQVAMLRTRDFFGATVKLEERQRELLQAGAQARKQEERITAIREERQTLMKSLQAEMDSRASRDPDPDVSELETFTYSVSHDLRSPMGAILNYAAVLNEDYGDQLGTEGREYLQRISASAQKAIGMMDGLLSFSRVGSQELKIEEVDVARMVREIHAELCVSRPGKRPTLSMGTLPTIHGDPTLLWTLFNNLLSNAFKFTQGVESPRVEVGGYTQGAEMVYYVADNGIGFDMRHASKLFGVFERLPSGQQQEGHGVGLAVVERIARRHGGSVRAEGVPGKGATFFVTLPIQPGHTDPGAAAATS